MFVSFLMPSAFEGRPARHLLVFYKQLTAFGRDGAAFIGESDYFRHPSTLRAEGRPELSDDWASHFGYLAPSDLSGVVTQAIPDGLFDRRLRRVRTHWHLYAQMVTRRMTELEPVLHTALDAIESRSQVEAVITFANVPSLARVAANRRLPLVHTHFGPLRSPHYVATGYWDRRGVNSRTDAERRFAAFQREIAVARFELFDREELLHTFRRTSLPDDGGVTNAPFRVGLALQGDENVYVQGLGPLDLLTMAAQHYSRDEVLVRYYPGSLASYSDSLGRRDYSPDATSFVMKCQTILTVNSGIAFEALLLGRSAVVIGDSPISIAADRSLHGRRRERLLALNFFAFGYMVPYALMFDPDYIRWRLTNPSEIDIIRRHQAWYRRSLTESAPPVDAELGITTGLKLLSPEVHGHRRIALFGSGAIAPQLIARLRAEQRDVTALFDNDPAAWNRAVAGVSVSAPAALPGTSVVVSSLTHADAMTQQLRALGYSDDRILRIR